jgi:hypothetical protein
LRWRLGGDEHFRRADAHRPGVAPSDRRQRVEQQHDVHAEQQHDDHDYLDQRLRGFRRVLSRRRDLRHRLRLVRRRERVLDVNGRIWILGVGERLDERRELGRRRLGRRRGHVRRRDGRVRGRQWRCGPGYRLLPTEPRRLLTTPLDRRG